MMWGRDANWRASAIWLELSDFRESAKLAQSAVDNVKDIRATISIHPAINTMASEQEVHRKGDVRRGASFIAAYDDDSMRIHLVQL